MTAMDIQWDVSQDMEAFYEEAREMILLKEQKTNLERVEARLKKSLMETLRMRGKPYGPENQHLAIEFPEPIRGIARFVRQSKSSTSVDETEAEAIARSKGIYDRLFKPVMALDQDAVLVAVREGLISDEELALIFPRKEINAFVPEKEKK